MEDRMAFSSIAAPANDHAISIHRNIMSGAAIRAAISVHARITLLLGLVLLLLVVAG